MREDLKNVEGGAAKKEQSFKIPKGYFVRGVDLDCSKPSCIICKGNGIEKRILIPEALAYYLTLHSCGSIKMRQRLIDTGRYEIQNGIRNLLNINEEE